MVNEKIKTIYKTITQNKPKCNLDRPTANIPAFLSVNVGKFEFLTVKKMFYQRKHYQKKLYNQKI